MSVSAINAYPTWTPVSPTNTPSTSPCFGTTAAGTSASGGGVSGSSDPFQQLDASLQAMLLQMQGGGAGTTQAIGQSGSVQADADNLVQAIEQSLGTGASTTAATTAASTQTASTSPTDPAQQTQGHHHHHHHTSGEDGGSGNGTNSSSASNSMANSLVADITQAIQSYGAPSSGAAG